MLLRATYLAAICAVTACATCPANHFQSRVDGSLCANLVKQPGIASADACRDRCCADGACSVWQWCNNTSCAKWAGAKCHTGNTTKGCVALAHWIGESVLPPPPTPAPPVVTKKRGFSGFVKKPSTCQDAAALNLADSWYYSWLSNPWGGQNLCKQAFAAGNLTAREFVPMIIGRGITGNLVPSYQADWRKANAKYLLGYNEPDYGNGHNHPHMMSARAAAQDWPNVQRIAAQFDPPLVLVAPSVSSNGPDAWDADGASPWLDYFLGNCTHEVPDCDPSLIKYLGMHDYVGDVDKLKRRVSGAVQRYGGRKVWLTEIAITKWGAPPPRAAQDAYLRQLLPYLDGSDDVFRYAWFTARNVPNQQNGGSNLLPSDSSDLTPTSTGTIYATF
eukprot:g7251.t1